MVLAEAAIDSQPQVAATANERDFQLIMVFSPILIEEVQHLFRPPQEHCIRG